MNLPLVVHQLTKRYDVVTAVDGLSFEVHPGEVFGLLGPNGAGKTTTIRIVMGIYEADEGTVRILGGRPDAVRHRVGYLPEERGLYRDLQVLDVLTYLGELKGMSRGMAAERSMTLLERFALAEWAHRPVRDLSRGMQQKVQFAASLVHDPELLILDEPFQGLDPVNVEAISIQIRELQAQGKTIVLSAHEMSLVEALCDRIVLINHGRGVLYGSLAEIKRRYAKDAVRVRADRSLRGLPGVQAVEEREGVQIVTLNGCTPQGFLATLVAQGVSVQAFEVASMPLQEVFVRVVRGEKGE
ncbi:MAG TPA: ATP-binding cassette domain-containing protein [Chloroflexi bacterium]|jgi:ABC-2 type transport system ATP-binding protein|nr:ATP-binding cassette domain-containing protein [Chloroflexota bacterium]